MVRIQMIDAAVASAAHLETSLDGADVVVLHGCAGADRSSQDLALALAARSRVVVLFPPQDPPEVDRLMAAGVVAAIPQSVSADDLVPLLTAAFHASVGMAGAPGTPGVPGPDAALPPLSRRECEVLGLIARGLTHQQIAHRLKISIHTVDTYIRRIKDKWKLGNKADLTRAAIPLMRDGSQLARAS